MFTSIKPIHRHKDPRPYRVIETGERVNESAFGRPGVTIIFDPREEFIKVNQLPVNEILDDARSRYTTDTWASSMFELADIAAWVKKIFGGVPPEWRTDLPPSDGSRLDDLITEIGETKVLPQLLHAGAVFNRLAACSEARGQDYQLTRGASSE